MHLLAIAVVFLAAAWSQEVADPSRRAKSCWWQSADCPNACRH